MDDDGTWLAQRVTLTPDSNDLAFGASVLEYLGEGELVIVEELVEVSSVFSFMKELLGSFRGR